MGNMTNTHNCTHLLVNITEIGVLITACQYETDSDVQDKMTGLVKLFAYKHLFSMLIGSFVHSKVAYFLLLISCIYL